MLSIAQRFAQIQSGQVYAMASGHQDPAATIAQNALPNRETLPTIQQGGNGCGTASLAMILSYLGDAPVSQAEIDEEIRRGDKFAAPQQLAQYAREHGCNAELYNQGTPQELASFIDRGVPVQLLISNDGSGGQEHYVIATGYQLKADGSYSFTIHDPNAGLKENGDPIDEEWDAAKLEENWGSTRYGFEHFFMAVSRPGVDLPASRTEGLEGTLLVADGFATFVTEKARIENARGAEDLARGTSQIAVSVPQTVVGAFVGMGQQGAAQASKEVRDKGLGGKLLAIGFDHFSSRLGTVAQAVGAVTKSTSHLHAAFRNLANGDVGAALADFGRSQLDLLEGVWNVVSGVVVETVKSAVDTVAAVGESIGETVVSVAKEASRSVKKFIKGLFS